MGEAPKVNPALAVTALRLIEEKLHYDPLPVHYLPFKVRRRTDCWIAGGSLRDRDWTPYKNDIDLWTPDPQAVCLLLLEADWAKVQEVEYQPGEVSTKLVHVAGSWGTMFWLDLLTGKSPEETILNFDYTVNCIAYAFGRKELIYHPDWKEHREKKLLVRLPNGQFISKARLEHMQKKGYHEPSNDSDRP